MSYLPIARLKPEHLFLDAREARAVTSPVQSLQSALAKDMSENSTNTRSGIFQEWHCMRWTVVITILLLGVLGYMTGTDRPERYPTDVQWWRGTVLKNFVWAYDGDQDIFTADGHYIVVDWPDLLEPGDTFYLLHAKSETGAQRTFFCTERKRESCGPLSLAVNPPFEAHTMNQGAVPPSAISTQLIGNAAGNKTAEFPRVGHYVQKGERG